MLANVSSNECEDVNETYEEKKWMVSPRKTGNSNFAERVGYF